MRICQKLISGKKKNPSAPRPARSFRKNWALQSMISIESRRPQTQLNRLKKPVSSGGCNSQAALLDQAKGGKVAGSPSGYPRPAPFLSKTVSAPSRPLTRARDNPWTQPGAWRGMFFSLIANIAVDRYFANS